MRPRVTHQCTSVAAGNDVFIHMLVAGRFQRLQKAAVDIARLLHDNIKQLFSCLDRLAAFGLNGLQLFRCQRIALKHVACNTLCVYCCRYFIVQHTQHVGMVYNVSITAHKVLSIVAWLRAATLQFLTHYTGLRQNVKKQGITVAIL